MKISVVVINYNLGDYLESTLLSIIDQNYSDLELIVIDGGSTDHSLEIINKYKGSIHYFVSEKDNGMYEALNKGLRVCTGEIMTFINSDDVLYSNSFFTVAKIFKQYRSIDWITGIPNHIDEIGRIVWSSEPKIWTPYHYKNKNFKYIQQEGTFWRKELWQKAGSYVSTQYKYAGDLELWSRFFSYADLYTVPCFLGAFRVRSKNQTSFEKINLYDLEAELILEAAPSYERIDANVLKISKTHAFNFLVFHKLFRVLKIINFEKAYNELFPSRLLLKYDRKQQSFYLDL